MKINSFLAFEVNLSTDHSIPDGGNLEKVIAWSQSCHREVACRIGSRRMCPATQPDIDHCQDLAGACIQGGPPDLSFWLCEDGRQREQATKKDTRHTPHALIVVGIRAK